jgi:hypothetical protein
MIQRTNGCRRELFNVINVSHGENLCKATVFGKAEDNFVVAAINNNNVPVDSPSDKRVNKERLDDRRAKFRRYLGMALGHLDK